MCLRTDGTAHAAAGDTRHRLHLQRRRTLRCVERLNVCVCHIEGGRRLGRQRRRQQVTDGHAHAVERYAIELSSELAHSVVALCPDLLDDGRDLRGDAGSKSKARHTE